MDGLLPIRLFRSSESEEWHTQSGSTRYRKSREEAQGRYCYVQAEYKVEQDKAILMWICESDRPFFQSPFTLYQLIQVMG